VNSPELYPSRNKRAGTNSTSDTDLSFREQALQIINMSLEEAKTQHPLDVPGIFHYERPTFGGTVPVSLYRAIRLLSFRELFGSRLSSAMLNLAGQTVAEKLGVSSLNDSIQALGDLGIARAAVDEHSGNQVAVIATECATCSGMPNIGEAICSFEAGLIAGGLKDSFDGKRVKVTETNCWGLGDRVCRWEASVAPDGDRATGNGGFETMDLIAAMAGKAALALDSAVAIREANRQLRQAYKQLRESERMMKDLTSMVVHDLRVPLTAVIGSMLSLSESAQSRLDPREQETLGISLAGGETLLQMINDLLDVNRLEERRLPLHCRPVSVHEIVDYARGQIEVLARRKKVGIKSSVPSRLPEVLVDRHVIERVLINLLGNAIRHTQPGGKITLQARALEGGVTLCVSDTGEGIPPEYLERIFDKFAQVESHRSRRSYSTGLGLTFCKLAVEAHGGRIWAESELGKGSTFTFTLPVEAV
jgi:signal transduction histidine kinase